MVQQKQISLQFNTELEALEFIDQAPFIYSIEANESDPTIGIWSEDISPSSVNVFFDIIGTYWILVFLVLIIIEEEDCEGEDCE